MTTCLIVEDSATQRKIISKIVESCGYDYIHAENGLQALEVCENEMPDVIILDLNMPQMSGIEFLNALDAVPKKYPPYVIVCSSNINTDIIVEAARAGANQYHCKSLHVESLRQKISNAPIH